MHIAALDHAGDVKAHRAAGRADAALNAFLRHGTQVESGNSQTALESGAENHERRHPTTGMAEGPSAHGQGKHKDQAGYRQVDGVATWPVERYGAFHHEEEVHGANAVASQQVENKAHPGRPDQVLDPVALAAAHGFRLGDEAGLLQTRHPGTWFCLDSAIFEADNPSLLAPFEDGQSAAVDVVGSGDSADRRFRVTVGTNGWVRRRCVVLVRLEFLE